MRGVRLVQVDRKKKEFDMPSHGSVMGLANRDSHLLQACEALIRCTGVARPGH